MANEIINSGLSGDLRVTEVLSRSYMLSLADRQAIQNHPALVYGGDARGAGSLTVRIGEIGWLGADQLSAVAEGASVTNSALVDTSHTVTVGRYAKAYSASDLAKITDSLGHLDPQSFAMDAVAAAGMTLTNLIAALMGGFSTVAGSTGVNMDVADWYEAVGNLRVNNVSGPYMAILHSQQYNDWAESLRAETGVLQLQQATAEQQIMRGTGYMGSFAGVDIFVSNQIPTANAGADRAGGMFGRNAIIWADGSFAPDPAIIGFNLGKVLLEYERDAYAGLTAAVTSYNLGVSEGQDLAGCAIVTDA